ncbi:Acetyl-coenzyme A synthetase [Variovorax sp. PBS-H4]|uniref:acyl-CoA synthetase n=1 Tax=Variovorax sp. PBS-H4 TaxID=434008 RepID=UPI0013163619|nr:acyl-CoA synthetase [Variovorax sp. PBS-H4]VTU37004.1 Acetyl-coenzyme A synthetase [Variovorax sp. PBS-H4]
MPPVVDSYRKARQDFAWRLPHRYNMGVDVCDRWARTEPDRLALVHAKANGEVARFSFLDLLHASNRLANCMRAHGVKTGDRVAILLGQSPETAFAHVATYRLGAIAVPLFSLFGEEALEYRLRDSGARLLLTDRQGAAKIAAIRERLPELSTVLVAGESGEWPPATLGLESELSVQCTDFEPVDTAADDPALIIYTSGTTGKPKGALHAHRVLPGHLPGVEMSHGGRIEASDLFWTPADWAWIGGLLDVLLPALHHGVPVVAHRFDKFEAAGAFGLMSRLGVRNVFLPPTALKMLRTQPDPRKRWDLRLRSVASGGESLGGEMLAWGREALGVQINEFYGQTECNMVVSSCAEWFEAKPGKIGKAVPGHDVQVVATDGQMLPAGSIGQIAVRRGDPVMFLGYWNNPGATAEKFVGEFMLTGDQGCMDDDGFIRFVGRDDDVITSAGYRIGPGPIEDCLLGHPSVHMAAVVGVPDAERTEVVKAFVVLAEGVWPSEQLTRELQHHVRTRLAAHEYPRLVDYVDALPMTTTGKVIRRALRDR